jgi:hypothetical protein
LPTRCQRLLTLLVADPPVPYAQICSRLQMPVGSIGPNRARCLDALRRSLALAAFIDADPAGEDAKHVARLGRVAEAVRTAEDVPHDFVEAGKPPSRGTPSTLSSPR